MDRENGALLATANDPDGTIAKVEFQDGYAIVGSVSEAPYRFGTGALAPGDHYLRALATDNSGATTASDWVLVRGNSGQPKPEFSMPTVSADGSIQLALSAPPGASFILESSVNLVDWQPLLSGVTATGAIRHTDAPDATHPCKFYRLRPLGGP